MVLAQSQLRHRRPTQPSFHQGQGAGDVLASEPGDGLRIPTLLQLLLCTAASSRPVCTGKHHVCRPHIAGQPCSLADYSGRKLHCS